MNAENALRKSYRYTTIYFDKEYAEICNEIKDATEAGKTEILFLKPPSTETFQRFKDEGYSWYKMSDLMMPFTIYTLSWAIPKPTLIQKIINWFKK